MPKFLNPLSYITDSSTEQEINLQTDSVPGTVPIRDADGRIKVGKQGLNFSNTSSDDIINKGYTDIKFIPWSVTGLSSDEKESIRKRINAAKALGSDEKYVLKNSSDYIETSLYLPSDLIDSNSNNSIINKSYVDSSYNNLSSQINGLNALKNNSSSVDGQYVSGFSKSGNTVNVSRQNFTNGVLLVSSSDQSVAGTKTFTNTLRYKRFPDGNTGAVNKEYSSLLIDGVLNNTLMKMTVNGQTTQTKYINNVSNLGTNIIVDWGDGSRNNYSSTDSSVEHTYSSTGNKNCYLMNVSSIGNSAFYNCTSLTSVAIPDSVTSIGVGAFGYCSVLTSITIPNGVTSIGEAVFAYCSNLRSATIGGNVTSIGEWAFFDCSSLTSITIKAMTPPTLSNANAFGGTNDYPIYVPAQSVNAYQTATNWSSLASRIQAIQ